MRWWSTPSLIHQTLSRESPQMAWVANGRPVVGPDRRRQPVLVEEPLELPQRRVLLDEASPWQLRMNRECASQTVSG